jgi:hypothetical protein
MEIKGKVIPVTGCEGLQGFEMLRITHCLHNRLTDFGELLSLTHRPRSTPQKHFCYRLSTLQGLVRLEGLSTLRNSLRPRRESSP